MGPPSLRRGCHQRANGEYRGSQENRRSGGPLRIPGDIARIHAESETENDAGRDPPLLPPTQAIVARPSENRPLSRAIFPPQIAREDRRMPAGDGLGNGVPLPDLSLRVSQMGSPVEHLCPSAYNDRHAHDAMLRGNARRTPASVLHAIASEASNWLRVATNMQPTARPPRPKPPRRLGLPMSRESANSLANRRSAHRARRAPNP